MVGIRAAPISACPPPFPFPDIVQHHGKEQQFPLVNFVGDLGQERKFLPVLSLPEPDDLFHGKQGMDINRVDVVEVVLHLAVDMFEFRDEAVEEFQVVHQSEGLGDTLVGTENGEK